MKQHFDCIIVGAGIAGISAAIYLKRADKKILLLESYIPGGQINKTSNVENYPGFTKIDGPTLVMNLVDQLTSLEIPLKYEEVIDIKKDSNFNVITKNNEYTSDNIIIATGRIPNLLGLENEQEYVGKGISYCALCDGNLYKDLDVVVVGGGNSAFEESLYLSKLCKKVTIINRSNSLRASDILQDEIKKLDNVEILYNESIQKINVKDDKIESVTLSDRTVTCQGIFIYIGLTPDLSYLKNLDLNINNSYIVVDSNMKTNIKNVYACGDVIEKNVYQIVTAAGEGATAATSLLKDMER